MVEFEKLQSVDLYPGTIYKAGGTGNYFRDEPIHELFKLPGYSGIGTQSGIRSAMVEIKGREKEVAFMVIVNRKNNEEWPNKYFPESNELIYFGDNKSSLDYLQTKQKGNQKLVQLNDFIEQGNFGEIWPIFYFEVDNVRDKDYRFIGLAYLVNMELIYDYKNNVENLKCTFTIDSTEKIAKQWLIDLKNGIKKESYFSPTSWELFLNQ